MKLKILLLILLHFLVAFTLFNICITAADEEGAECVYAIYVKTGSVQRAGTHSTIGLTLTSPTGTTQLAVSNLEDWGLMGSGHNYFETGSLDIFGGKGPCPNGPICGLNLTSDGSGPYHAWFCEYVQVGVVGLADDGECSQRKFEVNQWLAKDQPPYELSVENINLIWA